MAKILLVEDDNNLREIFEMRLQAEGYETVTAGDGEEALDVAMKEKPDLIIADVMMPRLSGFEMLETLRAAPGMNQVKVVMMTALGQAEDRARGEKLGVVKYLVKSQVTLEDFVRVVREVLQPDQAGADSSVAPATDSAQVSPSIINKRESEKTMPEDNMPTNNPAMPDKPADDSSASGANPVSGTPGMGDNMGPSDQMTSAQEQSKVDSQVDDFVSGAKDDSASSAGDSSMPASGGSTGPSDLPVSPPMPEPPKPDDDTPSGAPTPPPSGSPM